MKKNTPSKMKIGIHGLGTVGQGLLKILQSGDYPIEIVGVVDLYHEKKSALLKGIPSSDDVEFLLQNKDIDTHVELMGGVDTPLYIIRSAIDKGKNVVTANKALLAEHGYTLFQKAAAAKKFIQFEAAVAGAIPIIRNLEQVFCYQSVLSLEGILNGTTNYILTRMRKEEKPYTEILKDAQANGLAEANPAMDVNGTDAAQKLSILSSIITGQWAESNRIRVRGISDLSLTDVLWATRMGFRVRLIAKFQIIENRHYITVEPALVPAGHSLYDIDYENNAISLEGNYSGPHMFVGKGAGALPAAFSVLSDLMHLYHEKAWPIFPDDMKYLSISDPDDLENAFYARVQVIDKPGVLAAIAQILSNNNISIASVHQEVESSQEVGEAVEEGKKVDLVILTHKIAHRNFNVAQKEILTLKSLVSNLLYLPIY